GWLLQVVAQVLRSRGVPQLRESLRLDLTDPLARDTELAPDLLQPARVAVEQAEPKLDHLLLALGERVEDALELLLEQDERRRIGGDGGSGVLDEIAEVRIL